MEPKTGLKQISAQAEALRRKAIDTPDRSPKRTRTRHGTFEERGSQFTWTPASRRDGCSGSPHTTHQYPVTGHSWPGHP